MLPLFSVFLHFLQCFDYIFKFHEVRSLYEDGISRFHICVQVLKKAFQIFFPDDCQVWIGLRCLFRDMGCKWSYADACIDPALTCMNAYTFMKCSFIRSKLTHIAKNGNLSSKSVLKNIREAFMDMGFAL